MDNLLVAIGLACPSRGYSFRACGCVACGRMIGTKRNGGDPKWLTPGSATGAPICIGRPTLGPPGGPRSKSNTLPGQYRLVARCTRDRPLRSGRSGADSSPLGRLLLCTNGTVQSTCAQSPGTAGGASKFLKPDGEIFWYNRRWYEYTGTSPQEMHGWGWQSVHDPEALPGVLERWRASLATGEPFDMVFPLRGADGEFRPFLTRVNPLRDDQDGILYWFGTNTDVSEIKQMEAALIDADRRKNEFLAMLAHELRNPLAPIRNAGHVLRLATDNREVV